MQVPDAVRERMRRAGSGPQARAEGVAIAREMLGEVRSLVAGAYVMPPLERYELALRGGGRVRRAVNGRFASFVALAAVAMTAATVGCKTREVQDRSWLDAGGTIAATLAPGAAVDGAADAPRCQPSGARLAIPGGALVASDGISDDGDERPLRSAPSERRGGAGRASTTPAARSPSTIFRAAIPTRRLRSSPCARGSPRTSRSFCTARARLAPVDAGHARGRRRSRARPGHRRASTAIRGRAGQPHPRAARRLARRRSRLRPVSGSGLVVWDDDDPFARFGRIRAARLDAGGKVIGEPLLLTPGRHRRRVAAGRRHPRGLRRRLPRPSRRGARRRAGRGRGRSAGRAPRLPLARSGRRPRPTAPHPSLHHARSRRRRDTSAPSSCLQSLPPTTPSTSSPATTTLRATAPAGSSSRFTSRPTPSPRRRAPSSRACSFRRGSAPVRSRWSRLSAPPSPCSPARTTAARLVRLDAAGGPAHRSPRSTAPSP